MNINDVYFGKAGSPLRQKLNKDRIDFVVNEIRLDNPLIDNKVIKTLDVGCASGIVTHLIAEQGYASFGIDVADDGLEVARETCKGYFEKMDATNMTYDPDSFDLAHIGEVIEHHVDPSDILTEIQRVLKQGGYIYATVPWGYNKTKGHKAYYYEADFVQLMSSWFTAITCYKFNQYFIYYKGINTVGEKDNTNTLYLAVESQKKSMLDYQINIMGPKE